MYINLTLRNCCWWVVFCCLLTLLLLLENQQKRLRKTNINCYSCPESCCRGSSSQAQAFNLLPHKYGKKFISSQTKASCIFLSADVGFFLSRSTQLCHVRYCCCTPHARITPRILCLACSGHQTLTASLSASDISACCCDRATSIFDFVDKAYNRVSRAAKVAVTSWNSNLSRIFRFRLYKLFC